MSRCSSRRRFLVHFCSCSLGRDKKLVRSFGTFPILDSSFPAPSFHGTGALHEPLWSRSVLFLTPVLLFLLLSLLSGRTSTDMVSSCSIRTSLRRPCPRRSLPAPWSSCYSCPSPSWPLTAVCLFFLSICGCRLALQRHPEVGPSRRDRLHSWTTNLGFLPPAELPWACSPALPKYHTPP